MKIIDLKKIKLIREKNLDYLSNPKKIEFDLLPKLGFNNEILHEFPQELYPFCGKGLFHWQYPNQFSKYLVHLSNYNIKSYLEIGVRRGGTFIITFEYLNKFYPIKKAMGVDIIDCHSLVEYKKINSKIDFIKIDTGSAEFSKFIDKQGELDLVFIDGDHSEKGCRNDFELFKDKANIIVFHDIASDVCLGVKKVWSAFKEEFSNKYNFYEYIDQYNEVKNRTKNSYLGIGIAINRRFYKKYSKNSQYLL